MIDFFIEEITLHVNYEKRSIVKILEQGKKYNFKYYSSSSNITISEAIDVITSPVDQIKWFEEGLIGVKTLESYIDVWFKNKKGLLSLTFGISYSDKQFETELSVKPDSHYYLRTALKLCEPFCIKSIKTVSMN